MMSMSWHGKNICNRDTPFISTGYCCTIITNLLEQMHIIVPKFIIVFTPSVTRNRKLWIDDLKISYCIIDFDLSFLQKTD